SPGVHYSHVAFEGMSLAPALGANGEMLGANIVLFEERMQRMRNSIRSLRAGIPDETLMQQFQQGTLDLSAVQADRVLRDRDGNATRAYIRPSYVRLGTYGVGPKDEAPFHLSVIEWNWPLYISEEVYKNGAVAVCFLDAQRLEKIRGKLGGNYKDAGVHAKVARALNGNEALYFGPYIINQFGQSEYINSQENEKARLRLQKYGILVDGSGEDVIFEGRNGTIYYQPKDTNILGGTTREYIITHLAKRLGIKTEERPIGLPDIARRDVVGMAYVGNAVKVLPAREIRIYDSWQDEGKIKDFVELKISDNLQRIASEFEKEMFGLIPPSHPSLLTPVSLEEGRTARKVLDKVYSAWF
ncbi:MAG: aminotransferase class IV, partial [Patescibacteria group bacterium]